MKPFGCLQLVDAKWSFTPWSVGTASGRRRGGVGRPGVGSLRFGGDEGEPHMYSGGRDWVPISGAFCSSWLGGSLEGYRKGPSHITEEQEFISSLYRRGDGVSLVLLRVLDGCRKEPAGCRDSLLISSKQ